MEGSVNTCHFGLSQYLSTLRLNTCLLWVLQNLSTLCVATFVCLGRFNTDLLWVPQHLSALDVSFFKNWFAMGIVQFCTISFLIKKSHGGQK